jgi:hypothetical protein
MAGLYAESTRRIAEARRSAETVLKAALSGVRESYDVVPYLPAFIAFAVALFDAEVEELLTVCEDTDGFRSAIENELAPRIVEDILPADLGLTRVAEHPSGEVRQLSIRHDLDTGLLWERGPDGKWKPAGAEVRCIYAPRCDWERFMPVGVRFMARLPRNKATVRAALSHALRQRMDYWSGRFDTRPAPGGNEAQSRKSPAAIATPPGAIGPIEAGDAATRKRRMPATVTSTLAARRVEDYIKSKGMGLSEFSAAAQLTERTLLKFRRTGTVRRDRFDAIAKAMGMTREQLIEP